MTDFEKKLWEQTDNLYYEKKVSKTIRGANDGNTGTKPILVETTETEKF